MKNAAPAPKPQRMQQIHGQLRKELRERRGQENFIKPLTGKRAMHIARSESAQEYSPVLRGLKGQIRGSQKREGEISNWYSGLANQIGQTQASAAATSAAQEKALTERLAQAGAADTSALAAQAAKNAELAKMLGGPQNSGGQAQAAAGAQALAQQRVSLTAPLSTQRASYQNYLGQRQTSALERGIQAHGAERARRSKIIEDLQAGRKERGQATVKNLNALREAGRDYAIQKQAFGQKTKEFGAEQRENALERAIKAREAAQGHAIDVAKLGQSAAKLGLETRKTNQAARKIRREEREAGGTGTSNRKAMAEARSLYEAGTKDSEGKLTGWPSWGALAAAVAEKSEISSVEARRAVNRLRKHVEAKQKRSKALKKAIPSF